MAEQWLPVKGYEGLYEVSDHGRVRSLERVVMRSNGAPQKVRAKLLRQSILDGYPSVGLTLTRNGSRRRQVHRLMAEAFLGPAKGLDARHLDGCRHNNLLTNLSYGTRKENVEDARRHGTLALGERHGKAKLTTEQVVFARSAFKRKQISLTLLAKIWEVSVPTLSMAVSGRNWSHL